MLPKIPQESQQHKELQLDSNSRSSSQIASIHDLSAVRKKQSREAALKRVKAAAKNLSW